MLSGGDPGEPLKKESHGAAVAQRLVELQAFQQAAARSGVVLEIEGNFAQTVQCVGQIPARAHLPEERHALFDEGASLVVVVLVARHQPQVVE